MNRKIVNEKQINFSIFLPRNSNKPYSIENYVHERNGSLVLDNVEDLQQL